MAFKTFHFSVRAKQSQNGITFEAMNKDQTVVTYNIMHDDWLKIWASMHI